MRRIVESERELEDVNYRCVVVIVGDAVIVIIFAIVVAVAVVDSVAMDQRCAVEWFKKAAPANAERRLGAHAGEFQSCRACTSR